MHCSICPPSSFATLQGGLSSKKEWVGEGTFLVVALDNLPGKKTCHASVHI